MGLGILYGDLQGYIYICVRVCNQHLCVIDVLKFWLLNPSYGQIMINHQIQGYIKLIGLRLAMSCHVDSGLFAVLAVSQKIDDFLFLRVVEGGQDNQYTNDERFVDYPIFSEEIRLEQVCSRNYHGGIYSKILTDPKRSVFILKNQHVMGPLVRHFCVIAHDYNDCRSYEVMTSFSIASVLMI